MSARPSTAGTGATNGKGAGAEAESESGTSTLMNRRMYDSLKNEKQSTQDGISDAGSERDEEIPVYDEDPDAPMDDEACNSAAADSDAPSHNGSKRAPPPDRLTMLLADTPLKKLQRKSKEAESASKAGDLWGCLKLRQECLALANIYFGPYRGAERGRHPMLLATAHFRLAQAYADLKCFPQAGDHSNMAVQALPQKGVPSSMIAAFKCDVNLLMGESLLICEPPKPQIALQHFAAAADVGDPDQVTEPSIKILVAQSYAMIGYSKLSEAKTTKEAYEALETRLAAMKVKLDALHPRSMERTNLQYKMEEVTKELVEEVAFERKRLDEAKVALDKAVDMLTEVTFEEEERVKKENEANEAEEGAHKKHPLLISLFQRGSEMLLHLATVEGLRGDVDTELAHLGSILSTQRNYGFLPLGLVSTTLKEQGAVYVVRKRYDEALETYKELIETQTQRFSSDVAKLALAQAEAFKLLGNVYVAKKLYHRALEHYGQAADLFSKYQGPRSRLALDLEHRIAEIRSSYMDEA